MKNIIIVLIAILATLSLSNTVCAQTDAQTIISSAGNQESLLSRIYASDIVITSSKNDSNITGSFLIRNSETSSVGNIQYETMLLSPLTNTVINQLTADAPDIYDRVRSSETLVLKGGEKRTIPFSYHAPSVPQGSYRIRIQIITTNDRKLGWADTSVTLGGAHGFIIVRPMHVSVASSDPITKESGTTWEPLYGVNVNGGSAITFNAYITNPGSEAITGTVITKTKRLLYANQPVSTAEKQPITLPAQASKDITIPITTEKKPGAYITLVSVVDKNNQQVSGVAEYRYVVRGESASVASFQVSSLPATQDSLANMNFVLGGSADRATPVQGTLQIKITDSIGEIGSIDQQFSTTGASPITGTAQVKINKLVCGTPTVVIILTDTKGNSLDSYSTTTPAFANPSCKPPFTAYFTKSTINIILVLLAIGIVGGMLRTKLKNK